MQYWRNIKRYWENVEECDIDAGKAAYPAYHEMMRRIATRYQQDQVRVTEAFAALSPNNDYFGNLRSLVSLLDGLEHDTPYKVSTYKACARRAETYIRGTADFLSTVKGKKITAFRNCIVAPLTCEDFVLDGHMIAIALGEAMTMTEANAALRIHGYDKLSSAYIRFSARIGMRAPEVQATLWYCRKRNENIKFSRQKDLFYDDARLLYPLEDVRPYL